MLGRFFDHRVLDMMEYGVFNYIALSEFDTVRCMRLWFLVLMIRDREKCGKRISFLLSIVGVMCISHLNVLAEPKHRD